MTVCAGPPHPPAPSPTRGEGEMSHQDAQNRLPSPRVGEGLGVGVVRQQTVMYPRTLSIAQKHMRHAISGAATKAPLPFWERGLGGEGCAATDSLRGARTVIGYRLFLLKCREQIQERRQVIGTDPRLEVSRHDKIGARAGWAYERQVCGRRENRLLQILSDGGRLAGTLVEIGGDRAGGPRGDVGKIWPDDP